MLGPIWRIVRVLVVLVIEATVTTLAMPHMSQVIVFDFA
jgi:Tfp pilus assembly protein FimT